MAGIDLSAIASGSGGFVINGRCAGDVSGDGFAYLVIGAYYM